MKSVPIGLGPRSYEVVVGAGALSELAGHLPLDSVEQIVLIADRGAAGPWRAAIDDKFGLVIPMTVMMMPPGEESKSIDVAGGLLNQMAQLSLRRNDLVLTFGGGAVTDLGGFVASIYMRGLAVVHLPTTLLAQVDAAVGGKTAVNLKSGKNLVGSFHQPLLVVADTSTLSTLPDREYVSGLAEVIKYGFVLDPSLLTLLEDNRQAVMARDAGVMEEVVSRCVQLKGEVVARDERDASERLVLNYGHTVGHALEAATGFGPRLHGEAISVGMIAAAFLANDLGYLSSQAVEEHVRFLDMFGLPTRASLDVDHILEYMELDKKHAGGQRFVLLKGPGNPFVQSVDQAAVRRALNEVAE